MCSFKEWAGAFHMHFQYIFFDYLFLELKLNGEQNTSTIRGVGGTSVGRYKYDRERKLGHRRVGDGGEITYKKIQSSHIMGSIQLGIQHTVSKRQITTCSNKCLNVSVLLSPWQVGSLASKPKRDLLMMDFWELETISFPPDGSTLTPAHHFSEFRFKIYAPIAFRYFRDLFGIQPDDFLVNRNSNLVCANWPNIVLMTLAYYSCQCARPHYVNYPIRVHPVRYFT